MNPDIADADLLRHFLTVGVWEGRCAISRERLTARLAHAATVTALPTLDPAAAGRAYQAAAELKASIHLPLHPGEQARRIGARLAAALKAVGARVETRCEPPWSGAPAAIVVDPANVFTGALRGPHRIALYRSCLTAAPEAPAELGFQAQLPFLLESGGVITGDSGAYGLFAATRIPTLLTMAQSTVTDEGPPPDHLLVAGLGRRVRAAPAHLPWLERPIDVAALEPRTHARTQAWERMADGLARFTTVVQQPSAEHYASAEHAALRRYVYARSKMILHLPADAPEALPSIVVEAAANAGALLVTEPGPPNLLLKPGVHYIDASARRIPDRIEALLMDQPGQAEAVRVRDALQSLLARSFDPETVGLALVNMLCDRRGRSG